MLVGETLFRVLPTSCAKMQVLTPICKVMVQNLHSYGLMTDTVSEKA